MLLFLIIVLVTMVDIFTLVLLIFNSQLGPRSL